MGQKKILTGILPAREWRSDFYTSHGVTSVYPACTCKHEAKCFAQHAFFSTKASVFSRLSYCIKEYEGEKSPRTQLTVPFLQSCALTYTFYLVSSPILHSQFITLPWREKGRWGSYAFSSAAVKNFWEWHVISFNCL